MWGNVYLTIKKIQLAISIKIQVKCTETVYCQNSFEQNYKNRVLFLKRREPQSICYILLANAMSFLTSVS